MSATRAAPLVAIHAKLPISRRTDLQKRSARRGGCWNGSKASIVCLASKKRGFGPESAKKNNNVKTKEGPGIASETSKLTSMQPGVRTGKAPGLAGGIDGKPTNTLSDRQFMERLEAVKRSALEQKKAEEEKLTVEINYDAPIESDKNSIGIGTKVGVGIAVVVFGLVFALGDFLPSGSVNTDDQPIVAEKRLSEEEKQVLETKLRQYQETLSLSPDDLSALEGAAVTSAELGDYNQASSLLEKLTMERPKDLDAFRLLGEVKYELNDYEGSVAAYKNSLSASESLNFEVLRGLTNALLAARKPDEAIQVLLSERERLKTGNVNVPDEVIGENSKSNKEVEKIDPIQVDLLLGKAYSDWGHISDAVSVYDQLISTYPDDFRGYLAKGIILKENGNVGDAERMFIQARFFAPEKAKLLVDRYSRR